MSTRTAEHWRRFLEGRGNTTRRELTAKFKGTGHVEKVLKRKYRAEQNRRNKALMLGTAPLVYVNSNYVNPVTLNMPPLGVVVYRLKNRTTGRNNYYPRSTVHKLAGKNNYAILISDPRKPVFRNPYTRGNVYPRNLTRVRLAKRPTPRTAAKKIQSSVRKHLSKKAKK
jgi:hypothetical protein